MNDERPKDYSQVYTDDFTPIASSRNHRPQKLIGSLDGASHALKHREKIDLREVVLKLKNLPECQSDANYALSEHYKLCFVKPKNVMNYRVLIKYPVINNKADEIYAVRINQNTLKAVKDKLPKPGNFRFFFKTPNCLEEIESDDSTVPIYNESNGIKQIQVFLFNP